ncbi:hypothetical protein NEOKW01_0418 [Nematocida sp. AWRm80]|nr:hypothetical protein NEOKW01_0418 [Nematocida sp. AWRm80]
MFINMRMKLWYALLALVLISKCIAGIELNGIPSAINPTNTARMKTGLKQDKNSKGMPESVFKGLLSGTINTVFKPNTANPVVVAKAASKGSSKDPLPSGFDAPKKKGKKESAEDEAPAEKKTDAKEKAEEEMDLEEEKPKKAAPKPAAGSILGPIIIFGVVGLAIAGAAILGITFFVSRYISERTRRLRYLEALKPAYIKRGDGLDLHREMVE